MKSFKKIGLSILGLVSMGTYAQEFNADLQLRPRYEYRNGYGKPINSTAGEIPGSFISQRSRLNFNFKQDKLKTKLSLQNVRTWGDVVTNPANAPAAATTAIGLYEAWAEYAFDDNWSTRVGRQVISYDNQRIFGEIDWAQQGQSHDAAMVTFKNAKNQLDMAAAVNADAQNGVTPQPIAYTTKTYRNFQYAWYHTQMEKLGISLLALNTSYDFARNHNLYVTDYKQTFGTYLTFRDSKLTGDLGLYAQTGKSNAQNVSAFYTGFNIGYAVTTAFNAGLGYEYLSGKGQDDKSTTNKSFSPLFGTNHAFNGHMDYFYVGNYQNTVGLSDAFLKFNYTHNKWKFLLMPHYFSAAATVLDANGAKMNSYLGTEIDFNTSYAVQKDITLSGGYSQMFGTSTMQRLLGGTPASTNNWAWVMVTFSPRLF